MEWYLLLLLHGMVCYLLQQRFDEKHSMAYQSLWESWTCTVLQQVCYELLYITVRVQM
jgi:hypothetical protein